MATTIIEAPDKVVGGPTRSGDVVLADDRVAAAAPASVDRRFDARGLLVAPGFVDAQVNGAAGVDLTSEPGRVGDVASHLVRYGVTAFVPTVITCSPEQRAAALATEWVGGGAANPVGLHLEGPMIATSHRGAHPRRWIAAPADVALDGWTRADGVMMVTLAPELPGAVDAISRLVSAGVVVSVGHTGADAACVVAAVDAGARSVTHLFNAMAPFGHRSPGPVGAALTDDRLVAGLICDGLHVDPVAVRVAWRALGPERLMLVTDTTAALGLPPGRYRLGDTEISVTASGVRMADGTLAGSDLALDRAVRNLIAFTGCAVEDAIATVTSTPAKLLGLDDRGALAPGCRADVTILDTDLHVAAAFVGGELVHLAEGHGHRWRS